MVNYNKFYIKLCKYCLIFFCLNIYNAKAITIQEAIRLAYKNSETIGIKRQQADFGKINFQSSILGFLPSVSTSYGYNKIISSRNDMNNNLANGANNNDSNMMSGIANLSSAQTASVSMRSSLALWKTIPGLYIAWTGLKAKEEEYKKFLEDFGLLFVQTYMDIIYNTKALDVYSQMSNTLEAKVKRVTVMNKYGTVKRDKVVLAEAQYYKNKADEINIKSSLQRVKMDYKIMTGIDPVDLVMPDISGAKLPAEDKQSFVSLVLSNNSKIKQVYNEMISQKHYMAIQGFDMLPEPYSETSFMWYKIPGIMNYKAWYQGIGVSWTINGNNNRLANFRKEYKTYRIADLNYHLTLKEIEQDAEYAWDQYFAMLELVKATEKALKASKDSLQEVKVSVSTGTSTFIDEMDVENNYLNANLDYLNANKALILAYYKMIGMTGVGQLPVL